MPGQWKNMGQRRSWRPNDDIAAARSRLAQRQAQERRWQSQNGPVLVTHQGIILPEERSDVKAHAPALLPQPSPMQESAIFDLSSLTKPLATTTAVQLLVRDGRLKLDDRVTRFLPNFGVNGKI